jgi:hypothetical protein
MAKGKKSGFGKAILIASFVGIAGISAPALYMVGAKDEKPVATAAIRDASSAQAGTMLVPDGQGTCHKYSYGNDSGKATYEGTAACDHSKAKDTRSNLPPALRAMQDNLKR